MVGQYVLHVDYLANALLTPDIPLFCKKLPKTTAAPVSPHQRPAVLSQPSSSEAKPNVYRDFGRLVQSSQVGKETKKTCGLFSVVLYEWHCCSLEMHAELQENMTNELLKLARDLKQGTYAMQSALEKRDAAIDAAADALEYSAAAAKEASKNAAKQYKTLSLTTHFQR